MRKQMRFHIFGVLVFSVFGGLLGGCSTPVGLDAERTPANGVHAAESAAARPDTTLTEGAGGATVASDTVGRGGGFIGSGH
jgi:hypothetical protein